VTTISPDTIQDEVQPEVYYYRVFVRTETDALTDGRGNRLAIVPGMIAVVDIHTGEKSVLQDLLKPLNRAGEALRERQGGRCGAAARAPRGASHGGACLG